MIKPKKQETVDFYDYFDHFERFSFEWEEVQLQFRYSVKLFDDKKKLIKKDSMNNKNNDSTKKMPAWENLIKVALIQMFFILL